MILRSLFRWGCISYKWLTRRVSITLSITHPQTNNDRKKFVSRFVNNNKDFGKKENGEREREREREKERETRNNLNMFVPRKLGFPRRSDISL